MKVAVGADHRGVRLKRLIKRMLQQRGHAVRDFGAQDETPVDYPDYALPLARSVSRGENDRGILVCSTGIGMSIAANRVSGVRATLCLNVEMAQGARSHNNSNVLCLGQDLVDEKTCGRIVETWLTTDFDGARHERRVRKIDGP